MSWLRGELIQDFSVVCAGLTGGQQNRSSPDLTRRDPPGWLPCEQVHKPYPSSEAENGSRLVIQMRHLKSQRSGRGERAKASRGNDPRQRNQGPLRRASLQTPNAAWLKLISDLFCPPIERSKVSLLTFGIRVLPYAPTKSP